MTDEEFNELLADYEVRIRNSARVHPVPGMDQDDVVQEMRICLWKARATYEANRGEFGTYWWSVWLNHRANLIKRFFRMKRPKEIPVDDLTPLDTGTTDDHPRGPEPSITSDPTSAEMWLMIGEGFSMREIVTALDINNHVYYRQLRSWQTDEVRRFLQGGD